MLVHQIRQSFLDFFKEKGHEVVPSAPLVPHNDPTLLFTNAGMVPFKDCFTGVEDRGYHRATSSQKCVRAGGKHNDLDNVGYTARHHTFFEMLGNFSFGDYFKEQAISHAWECLTEVFQLPPEKLLVTVYHDDDEAFAIWKKITGWPDDKIIRISTDDNFWSMGAVGPCGPCSEIFYDHGPEIAGGPPGSPDEDGDRFIEIWNLVFMQYEMLASGERVDLPKPSIDTGMGLERISAILQNVHDNYDIDLFQNLIQAVAAVVPVGDKGESASYKVIADHLRSMCFLLADGVMPSNEGRGYVLRRIMRRAMRHARALEAKTPVIFTLVPALIAQMGEAYPELSRAQDLMMEVIRLEEERFGETLGRGLKILEDEVSGFAKGNQLSGAMAFKLYDTYGFPLDLTIDILRNREITVDEAGFAEGMKAQKERAKAAWKGSGDAATESIWFDLYNEHGATEFLGYELEEAQGNVLALVKEGQLVDMAKEGDEVMVLLNQTPFYGESGGQEGDSGVLIAGEAEIDVSDTSKVLGHLHLHHGKITKGELKNASTVTAKINGVRRNQTRANHSATHILHEVLRRHLGEHVTQKGSLVSADRFRFDFSHPKAVGAEELLAIETEVNEIIRQNHEVATVLMQPEEAIKAGAMALFGEKYGDEVRVVSMGKDNAGKNYSVELCGGTHVARTGDIAVFKIVSESAIAAGIRRIEAMTGNAVLQLLSRYEETLSQMAGALKVPIDEVGARTELVLSERKNLQKELAAMRAAQLLSGSDDDAIEEISGHPFLGKICEEVPPKDLRDLAMNMQKKIGEGVVAVVASFEGKSSLIISVSEALSKDISAVDLVRAATENLGAKGGGGKPHFAQSGGTKTDALETVLADVKAAIN